MALKSRDVKFESSDSSSNVGNDIGSSVEQFETDEDINREDMGIYGLC